MSELLHVEVSAGAAGQIREAEAWWRTNRHKAPNAIREELERASALVAAQPLVLYSVGQALVIPNWVAGPSNLIAFPLVFALRVRGEEKMMVQQFGDEYAAYTARTKRLVPRVW